MPLDSERLELNVFNNQFISSPVLTILGHLKSGFLEKGEQVCARMEDLTFPKNRKRRETTRVRSPNLRICAVDVNDITPTYGPQVTSLVRTVLKLMPITSLVRMGLKQYVSKDRRIVTRTYGPQTIRK